MSMLSPRLQHNVWWMRDQGNPVLPPGEAGTFDATCCMNPYVLRHGDEYYLYYAGGDDEGRRRICLATAPVANPTRWERHGPLFDIGAPGSFDARWCVLPHVVQFAPDRWHLYYTSNNGVGAGLSAFPGIGLAISTDGKTWEKYEHNPILTPTGKDGDPDAMGIAGGSVLKVRLPDGGTEWRFYYTGCPTLGDDLFLNQQKCCCLAVSQDGIHWERRGAVMLRNPEYDYENVAAAGPVVFQAEDNTYRMWYSAIGTRWGAYSIAYAESPDGITWQRGTCYGDNLQLGPIGTGWERQMVEYPAVIREGDRLRLFYCGNGYGATGIGTALSTPLRATATPHPGVVEIVAPESKLHWRYTVPSSLTCTAGNLMGESPRAGKWHGPDAKGMLWYEWSSQPPDQDGAATVTPVTTAVALELQRIRCRVMLTPVLEGVEVTLTIANGSEQMLTNLTMVTNYQRQSLPDAAAGELREEWEAAEAISTLSTADNGTSVELTTATTVGLGNVAPGATITWRGSVQPARVPARI